MGKGKSPLILINEVMPKVHSTCMSSSRVDIPDYFRLAILILIMLNKLLVAMRGICISYVSNKLVSTEVYFSGFRFIESLWIKITLCGSNSILVGCVYRSPSYDFEK